MKTGDTDETPVEALFRFYNDTIDMSDEEISDYMADHGIWQDDTSASSDLEE